ncbi:hypothetical protein BDB01DRAFT_9509 [Pilobolus umbonatus]|nr:hypothetical protein BDB01DRAFT_9509 [Pilobolus umbonatus]
MINSIYETDIDTASIAYRHRGAQSTPRRGEEITFDVCIKVKETDLEVSIECPRNDDKVMVDVRLSNKGGVDYYRVEGAHQVYDEKISINILQSRLS